MKRILIIGSGGSGKSTLSIRLQKILQIPLIHLDQHYWSANWVEPTKPDWEQKIKHLMDGEMWIMDGNYSNTLEMRLAKADTVIFLDFPRWKCIIRVLKRNLQYHGSDRPSMAEGCPEKISVEFLTYLWKFPQRSRPKMLRLLEFAKEEVTIYILKSDGEIANFLKKLSSP
ncbi:MAG: DNA topology modulation protein [Chitinophagales bacterium]